MTCTALRLLIAPRVSGNACVNCFWPRSPTHRYPKLPRRLTGNGGSLMLCCHNYVIFDKGHIGQIWILVWMQGFRRNLTKRAISAKLILFYVVNINGARLSKIWNGSCDSQENISIIGKVSGIQLEAKKMWKPPNSSEVLITSEVTDVYFSSSV